MLQFTPRRHEIRNSLRSVKIQLSSFSFASFAPAHVALRAACGRLPGQRPLARVQVSGLKPICPAHKLLPDFLKGFTLLKATSSKKPV
jgi:hypothetical protein